MTEKIDIAAWKRRMLIKHNAKRVVDLGESCPVCGNAIPMFTHIKTGYACDGEPAECCECGIVGSVVCDSETPAYIDICWDDANNLLADKWEKERSD